MDNEMTGCLLIFVVVLVFGTMIGTYQVAKLDSGYVAIPSNRYCEGLGYVRQEPKKEKTQ